MLYRCCIYLKVHWHCVLVASIYLLTLNYSLLSFNKLKFGWWGIFEQLEQGQIKEYVQGLVDEKFAVKWSHRKLISFFLYSGRRILIIDDRKSIPNMRETIIYNKIFYWSCQVTTICCLKFAGWNQLQIW